MQSGSHSPVNRFFCRKILLFFITERVVDAVTGHGEPFGAVFCHVEMIFQSDAKFAGHTYHWLVGETHAGA